MSVKTRLVVTLALVAGLLAGPAIYGASRLAELRNIAVSLRTSHAEAFLAVGRLQADLTELDRLLRSYIILGEARHRDEMWKALADTRAQWERLGTLGYDIASNGHTTWLVSLERAIALIDGLVESGERGEATAFLEASRSLFADALAALEEAGLAIDAASSAEVDRAAAISYAGARRVLLSLLAALAVGLGVGLWITGTLTAPLGRLRDSMASVAQGRFDPPADLPYHRADEIGDLSRSFRSMTHQLAELDRLRAEFLGVIGHDLKTPLNLISGYAQLVEESVGGESGGESGQMLSSILEQSQHLTRLVNQLLNLSRFEAGAFELYFEEVDVPGLFAGLDRAFRPMARQRRIRFDIDVEPSAPAAVVADAECLYNEVLYNLLANAFKFTPDRGRIRVRAWGDDDGLHVAVSDSGPGIAPDVLPFIFDKFFRAGPQPRGEGAGLGLAIVRAAVEAHGGAITVQSEPGRGTTFQVVLPARRELEVAAGTASA